MACGVRQEQGLGYGLTTFSYMCMHMCMCMCMCMCMRMHMYLLYFLQMTEQCNARRGRDTHGGSGSGGRRRAVRASGRHDLSGRRDPQLVLGHAARPHQACR